MTTSNNDVTCPQCGALFVGGIRANYVTVNIGNPIPRQQYKEKVCNKLQDGSKCLTRSLLAKIDLTNKIIASGFAMSNVDSYKLAKDLFKQHNITTNDYLVRLTRLFVNNLHIDQEYKLTVLLNSKRYDNVVMSFANTYEEAYLLFEKPFDGNPTDLMFDLFNGSTLIAEGVFA